MYSSKEKIKTKEEVLPEWFNQNIEKKKMNEEDEKTLKEMLKELS